MCKNIQLASMTGGPMSVPLLRKLTPEVPPAGRRAAGGARAVSGLLAALAGALGLSACMHSAAPPPQPQIVVATPVQAAADDVLGRVLRYPAEVAPRYSNVMAFRVPGQIIERSVRLG